MGANDSNKAANEMVDLFRDLVIEQLETRDKTDVCRIFSINPDGTYNIVIPPDERNVVSNIKSISSETLFAGDYAYILKIKNRLNNSLILTRIGPATDTKSSNASANVSGGSTIGVVDLRG